MRSVFVRQVAQISVLLLLMLTLLGAVFRLGMTEFLERRQLQNLSGSASALAELSRAYTSAEEMADSWDFRMSVSLASHAAQSDAVICDVEGNVLICACDEFSCLHQQAVLPAEFLQTVLTEGTAARTSVLPGLYEEKRQIHGQLLTSYTEQVTGIVVVSSPVEDVSRYLQVMLRVFLFVALGVWAVTVPTALAISRREIRTVKKMAETVSRFSHGDFSARIDVSRKHTAEMNELAAAFNNMADELSKAEKLRAEFVANVSHELKTPMTSITGYLDAMLDGTIPPEQQQQYIRTVADEARRLSGIVRSMLEISRMQADGIREEQKVCFDVGDDLSLALLSYEEQIRRRRLEVEVQLPDDPVIVKAHRDSIGRVMSNLIDNAVKFANDCGTLTLCVRTEGAKALVTVKNTGPVIPARELPFIFDRFHKLDKSRSKDPTGVGLGLHIVKTIIGAHGEEIWAYSHDGETAFTFTLPVVKQERKGESFHGI